MSNPTLKFDFLVTDWQRVIVPEIYEEEVLSKIKSGEITNAGDIFDMYPNAEITDIDGSYARQLQVDQNNGNSTIEVLRGTKYIYYNGKEQEQLSKSNKED